MCGIVGCITRRERASRVLLDGLYRLEYRGYDSAGIALWREGEFSVVRRRGRVRGLECARTLAGRTGIGHTRWATHGAPSECNAHPHVSGKICLVHNGILENAQILRERCLACGGTLYSETDSEAAAWLIDRRYRATGDLLAAVRDACAELVGSYAFCVLCKDKNEIVCARMHSPLIVSAGEDGVYAASDLCAVAGRGKRAYALADGEFARLREGSIEIFDGDLNGVERAFFPVAAEDDGAAEEGEKGAIMRREIAQVPSAIENTIKSLSNFDFSAVDKVLCQTKYLHIVACGTAYHSGLCFAHAAERLSRVPARVFLASEYRYGAPVVGEGTLTVAISQSGETADTLAAAELARRLSSPVLAVVNVPHSSLTRLADHVLPTRAGRETAVAATKSFCAQLAALYLLAARLAFLRGLPAPSPDALASLARETLAGCGAVASWAEAFARSRSVFFLGRGADRFAALEGSLKLKEVSYLPSEGYAAGELKHGTLALVDERTPVVAVACDEALFEKTMNAVHEVRARGAPVYLITPFAQEAASSGAVVLPVPRCEPVFSPAVSVIPLQLLAWHTAIALGCDPDKPRNLAKSVTVE